MAQLTIKKLPCTRSMDTMRIGGFADGELEKLKSMEHKQAKELLLDMLDDRNNKLATVWHNGYGIYECWFDNEFAYLNIGSSCD